MPRPPRVEFADGIFHVASRSVFERPVFESDDDRRDFLNLLADAAERCSWRCKSYCLMGTHYHLIVQTPKPNLSTGIQLLNGRYAQRFNVRHGRRGHLFSERFYSVLIETDGHLYNALRYVARNPVAAGLCANPADWRWSSYRSIVGKDAPLRLLDVDGVLRLFSVNTQAARTLFARFVEDMAAPAMSDGSLPAGLDRV